MPIKIMRMKSKQMAANKYTQSAWESANLYFEENLGRSLYIVVFNATSKRPI